MERITHIPRIHWQEHVANLGCSYYMTGDDPYWNESAYYQLSSSDISEIVNATRELEKRCLELVDYVVRNRCYERLNIPQYAWPLIESSWQRQEQHFYGRMDFSYNGHEPPKLLEYNADTPTTLIESALLQKDWLDHVFPHAQQYNFLHENIIQYWSKLRPKFTHLTCIEDIEEEYDHIHYLANTMEIARITPKKVFVSALKWHGNQLIDHNGQPINALFK